MELVVLYPVVSAVHPFRGVLVVQVVGRVGLVVRFLHHFHYSFQFLHPKVWDSVRTMLDEV